MADADTESPGGGDGQRESRAEAMPQWAVEEFRLCLGVDTRALAVFRMALGLVVLVDLLIRARTLRTLYTDAGVLPRSVLASEYPWLAALSVHTASGGPGLQWALLALAGLGAIALVVGYRPRLMAGFILAFYLSLFARNPHVLYGGDGLVLLGLFFGMFLPLGRRWGIEAGDDPGRIATLASAALLLQLVVIYTANGIFKLHSDLWLRGDALRNVLQMDQYAIAVGPHLTGVPGILTFLTWSWMALLFGSILLIAATGALRVAVVVGFVGAHVGMMATIQIGIFPLIVIAFLFLYLPAEVWDRIERRVEGVWHPRLEDRPIRRWRALQGRTTVPPVRRIANHVGTVLLILVVVGSLAWPAAAVGLAPAGSDTAAETYPYTLFSPNPPTDNQGFALVATHEDGERSNVLDGSPVDGDDPWSTLDTRHPNLWNQYLTEMRWGSQAERDAVGGYLCRRGTGTGDPAPTNVTVYRVAQPTEVTGGGDRSQSPIVELNCRA